ncbi:MAG TPA: ATP-binding protein [Lentimicrobium sp.]|jgi:anti-sigma regulatory factor (Ser/Thr protein kinase)|nr:ATP-binding protein [Lentimicrobium sp.]
MHFEFQIEGGNFSKAGAASSQLKKILKQLNVDVRVIKRVVVALYEAEVNIVAHAWEGIIYIDIDTEKIEMKLVDKGPGIADIELAMQQGYSTASQEVREMGFGAGMGLPNIKNNSDLLKITSEVGTGTTVAMTVYLNS